MAPRWRRSPAWVALAATWCWLEPIAGRWREVEDVLNGVSMVAVNGPASLADARGLSVLRSARLPLKSASMRGVVLSGAFGRRSGLGARGGASAAAGPARGG